MRSVGVKSVIIISLVAYSYIRSRDYRSKFIFPDVFKTSYNHPPLQEELRPDNDSLEHGLDEAI